MEINPKAHATILKAVRGIAIGLDTTSLSLTDGTRAGDGIPSPTIGRFIGQQDGSYGFQYDKSYLSVDTEVSIRYIRPCLEALNTMSSETLIEDAQPSSNEETA